MNKDRIFAYDIIKEENLKDIFYAIKKQAQELCS